MDSLIKSYLDLEQSLNDIGNNYLSDDQFVTGIGISIPGPDISNVLPELKQASG